MRVVLAELDDTQDEVVGLVERVENLVTGDRDGVGRRDTPFNLDEPQLTGAGHPALDVVPELLKLAVSGLEAEATFDVHDDSASPRGTGLGIDGRGWRRCGSS